MLFFGNELSPWSPEAVATLITGLTAVGAAVYVGLKQTAIGRRQTAILERQAEIQIRLAHLEKMKIRVSVFDKRFEVYEATLRLLVQILQRASMADDDVRNNFTRAIDRSRLLFGDDVYGRLKDVWSDVCRYGLAQNTLKQLVSLGGAKANAEYQKHAEVEAELLNKFSDLVQNLSVVFDDKLILNEQVGIE